MENEKNNKTKIDKSLVLKHSKIGNTDSPNNLDDIIKRINKEKEKTNNKRSD